VLGTSISGTDITGAGAGDGTIDLTVTGGTPGYSYSWTGPLGFTNIVDQDPTGLIGGTYYVTVTDANGCMDENTITLTEDGIPTSETQQTDILCNGESTGTIIVIPSGGVPFAGENPYTYEWSHDGGFTDSIATNLPAGSYEIVITDFDANTDTARVTLFEPDKLQHSVTAQNVTCFGEGDGKVDLIISGGVLPYSYNWNTAAITQNISDLGQGVYQGIITDANGCKDTANAIVLEPSQLIVTPTVGQITCFGDRNGKIVLSAAGGSPGYSYMWSNELTSDSIDFLLPGNYTYEVTDLNGCMETEIISIVQPDLVTGIFSGVKASCFGFSNGEATVVPAGGTGPYTYLWDDVMAQTTATADNLSSGDYTVTITDYKSCNGEADQTILQNSQIIVTNDSLDHIACSGFSDGAVYNTVSGGTGPYTYLWSENSVTEDLTGVPAGSYSLTVTDAESCPTPAGPFVVNELGTPIVFSEQTIHTDFLCFDDTAKVVLKATGGTGGLEYSINDGTDFQADTLFLTTSDGPHITVVMDIEGCTEYGDTLTLSSPVEMVVDVQSDTLDCFGDIDGQLMVDVTGGTPSYTYSWDTDPVKTTQIATGLAAGDYTVDVTDANGCTANDMGTLIELPAVSFATVDIGGDSILVIPAGGTPLYTLKFYIDDSLYNSIPDIPVEGYTLQGLPIDTVTIKIVDANGCEASDSTVILGIRNNMVWVRNMSVYPNPNTGRFTIEMDNKAGEDIDLQVISLLGQTVYREFFRNDGAPRFIRTINLGEQARGAYFLRVNGLPVKARLMIY
jgi:hypothetical protein